MNDNPSNVIMGLQAMLCCLALPGALGGLAGWVLRGRVMRMGIPWAFLPGFSKRLYEYLKIQIEKEDQQS